MSTDGEETIRGREEPGEEVPIQPETPAGQPAAAEERSPVDGQAAPPTAPGVHEREAPTARVGGTRGDGDPKRKGYRANGRMKPGYYEKELARLQEELVKLQYWVREHGLRVVVLFEGRDAAGKGGVIKRITESMSHRIVRVVALDRPTEREQTQWYFQRYVAHLPAAGEIVLFDRSWYNRALVERVMEFCTDEQYWQFMQSCPQFERMLIRDGMILVKYWFSVSDEEQERRFQARAHDIRRRWKLSPMDLEARRRWLAYSRAKDTMFEYTDTKVSPWWVVNSDDKKRSRLNTIHHLLTMLPYEDIMPGPIELPAREDDELYVRMPYEEQTFVPEVY